MNITIIVKKAHANSSLKLSEGAARELSRYLDGCEAGKALADALRRAIGEERS